MKGFDWNEDVRIRITDESGISVFPYRDANGIIHDTVKTAAANDEDILENLPSSTDGSDLSPVFEHRGVFYLQALERNRDVGWGTLKDADGVLHGDVVPPGGTRTVSTATWNQRVSWAQLDWASEAESTSFSESYPGGPPAEAINLAVIVSPFAPPNGIEEVTRADRLAGVPWRILPDHTLVITGTNVTDSISVEFTDSDGSWTLTLNQSTYQLSDGEFTSVYVDGGEGDDLISLQNLPTTIGATVFGGSGNDSIYGGQATDFLVGNADDDFIVGGPGDDWIFGSQDNDILIGHLDGEAVSSTIDHLFGESGADQLFDDGNDDSSGGMGVGWQHRLNRLDVTNDGQVVPLDALAIINELNDSVHCETNRRLPELRPLDAFYYDSNGDGFCTPVGDVLPIINFLNDRTVTPAGELSDQREEFVQFTAIDLPASARIATATSPSHKDTFTNSQTRSPRSWTKAEKYRLDAEPPITTPTSKPSLDLAPTTALDVDKPAPKVLDAGCDDSDKLVTEVAR